MCARCLLRCCIKISSIIGYINWLKCTSFLKHEDHHTHVEFLNLPRHSVKSPQKPPAFYISTHAKNPSSINKPLLQSHFHNIAAILGFPNINYTHSPFTLHHFLGGFPDGAIMNWGFPSSKHSSDFVYNNLGEFQNTRGFPIS